MNVQICADVRAALPILNTMLEDDPVDPAQFAEWRDYLDAQRTSLPMQYPKRDDVVIPQWAIEVRADAIYPFSRQIVILTAQWSAWQRHRVEQRSASHGSAGP
jgi:hypothetical protein